LSCIYSVAHHNEFLEEENLGVAEKRKINKPICSHLWLDAPDAHDRLKNAWRFLAGQ
jgi:hypothetical protein